MGAVLVPVNMWLRAAEIGYILNNSQPRLLVVSPEFQPLAETAVELLPEPPRLILRGTGTQAPGGGLTWTEFLDAPADRPISRPSSWEDRISSSTHPAPRDGLKARSSRIGAAL
jgi:fatty-acyl-CoA synthase